MNHKVSFLKIFFTLFFCASLSLPVFGSESLDTVLKNTNQMPSLFDELAKESFRAKWAQGFNEFLMTIGNQIINRNSLLREESILFRFDKTNLKEENKVIDLYRKAIYLLKELISYEQEMKDLQTQLNYQETICRNKDFFLRISIHNTLRVDLVLKVENFIKNVWYDDYFLLKGERFDYGERNEIRDSIYSNFRGGGESSFSERMFYLSSEICLSIQKEYLESLNSIKHILNQNQRILKKKRELILLQLPFLEQKVLQIGKERIFRQYGLQELFDLYNQIEIDRRVSIALSNYYFLWMNVREEWSREIDPFKSLKLEDHFYKLSLSYMKDLTEIQKLPLSQHMQETIQGKIKDASSQVKRINRKRKRRL